MPRMMNPAINSAKHLRLVERLRDTFHEMRGAGLAANAYGALKTQAHTQALNDLRAFLDDNGILMPVMKYPHLIECSES